MLCDLLLRIGRESLQHVHCVHLCRLLQYLPAPMLRRAATMVALPEHFERAASAILPDQVRPLAYCSEQAAPQSHAVALLCRHASAQRTPCCCFRLQQPSSLMQKCALAPSRLLNVLLWRFSVPVPWHGQALAVLHNVTHYGQLLSPKQDWEADAASAVADLPTREDDFNGVGQYHLLGGSVSGCGPSHAPGNPRAAYGIW